MLADIGLISPLHMSLMYPARFGTVLGLFDGWVRGYCLTAQTGTGPRTHALGHLCCHAYPHLRQNLKRQAKRLL